MGLLKILGLAMAELCLIAGAIIIGKNSEVNVGGWFGLLLILAAVAIRIGIDRDFK